MDIWFAESRAQFDQAADVAGLSDKARAFAYDEIGYGVIVCFHGSELLFQPFVNGDGVPLAAKPFVDALRKMAPEERAALEKGKAALHPKFRNALPDPDKPRGVNVLGGCMAMTDPAWWDSMCGYVQSYKHLFQTVRDEAPQPLAAKKTFLLNLTDRPVLPKERAAELDGISVLSGSTTADHADIPIVVSDAWEAANPDLPFVRAMYKNPPVQVPWAEKVDKCVFRGTNTSCLPNYPALNHRLNIVSFLRMRDAKRRFWDVGLVGTPKYWLFDGLRNRISYALNLPEHLLAKRILVPRQAVYKFVLSLPGFSASYQIPYEFTYGSCVVFVPSEYKCWFETMPGFDDCVHKVDLASAERDLPDVERLLTSKDAVKNPQTIAANASKFARTHFTRDALVRRMQQTLLGTAEGKSGGQFFHPKTENMSFDKSKLDFQAYKNAMGIETVQLSKDTLKADDSGLVVIDMQIDFACDDSCLRKSGSFLVQEAGKITAHVSDLINTASKVYATKDFHPQDHVSFWTKPTEWPDGIPNGFPPHCVQHSGQQGDYTTGATVDPTVEYRENAPNRGGARFLPDLIPALKTASEKDTLKGVYFKGFVSSVESFGGLEYHRDKENNYLPGRDKVCFSEKCLNGTGSYRLLTPKKMKDDVDADPDYDVSWENLGLGEFTDQFPRFTLGNDIGELNNIFVCGLALDFCVLDTAINARLMFPDKNVYIVLDACRPAFVEPAGGYLTPPGDLAAIISKHGIQIASFTELDRLQKTPAQKAADEIDTGEFTKWGGIPKLPVNGIFGLSALLLASFASIFLN